MVRYTEGKSVSLSEEQWREMKEAVKSGEYKSDAAYIRAMIEAGKSNIAALDPRTSDAESQSDVTLSSPSEAARMLSDEVLIDSLKRGEDSKQKISEVLKEPSNRFQSQLANRLNDLADEDTSPIQSAYDPDLGASAYWLEGDKK
jgi:Arc/MetJ-type ribon-helix-helix transcriptional regulator